MDQTFITIHNLTPDANILFASDSITDILGFLPHEVQNKSCFDFFHPHEVPFARSIHRRGVRLDKAAVLHYARVLSVDGRWVNCECCFTIVHDVLVACTSIYRRTLKSEMRAVEAPQIRRLFSCSPQDPRYHMLEHLSPKFRMSAMEREPRAALIINRFTRSLSIMFSTNAVTSILGVSPQDLQDQSFYDCIAENCIQEAIRCLESAKANDSIAYLRFWFKDPRRPDDFARSECSDSTGEENDLTIKSEPDAQQQWGRGSEVPGSFDTNPAQAHKGISHQMDVDDLESASTTIKAENSLDSETLAAFPKRASSEPRTLRMSEIPERSSPAVDESIAGNSRSAYPAPSVELEAVVSCTSDGLVVIIRRARPPMPGPEPPRPPGPQEGLFAAPWAQQPINSSCPQDGMVDDQYATYGNLQHPRGPPLESLMRSIRDVAVFAWALVGINENIAMHGNGTPQGDAIPSDWAPPPNGYPVRPSYKQVEEGLHQPSGECWIGCRCKASRPPTFGYPKQSGRPPSVIAACACRECQLHEQSLSNEQWQCPQLAQGRHAVRDARPTLRSHASTSSLPTHNTTWHMASDARPRRAHNWRGSVGKWPYPRS